MPISIRLARRLTPTLLFSWPALAGEAEHWSLQGYLASFPEQQARSEAFSQRIRAPAEPWQGIGDRPVRIAMISPDGQLSDYWRRHRVLIEKLLVRDQSKLILQNITIPLKDWQQRQPLLYVGFDHALGIRQLAAREPVRYRMLYCNRGNVSGFAIAKAIRLDREGKTDAIPGVYSGNFAVVTQDTPLAELERLKAYAFRYSH